MKKVRCIVVGAGPAGSACAYSLAQKGIETVLLERERIPGEKNAASFFLIPTVLKYLIPDFKDDAPLERTVYDMIYTYLQKDDFINVRTSKKTENPIGITAFRSSFDAWFAQKAKDAGAELLSEMTVTDLIEGRDRIIGVRVGSEELYSDVVVLADGVLSNLAINSGLLPKPDRKRMILGVKEVLDLPSDIINERLQLKDNQGCIIDGRFYPFKNSGDIFSLYTNQDSISLALFGGINSFQEKESRLHERFEMLKEHPYIHSLIKDATLRMQQSHILSDGRQVKPENLYGDGFLLCGEAGGLLGHLFIGVPPAMLSGMMAAETIELAVKKNNYGTNTLKRYLDFLDTTTLLSTIKKNNKLSSCLPEKGRNNLPQYLSSVADGYVEHVQSLMDFIEKVPHPTLKKLYLDVEKERMSVVLRWIVSFLVSLSSIKRAYYKLKERGRYHKWKKQYNIR